MRRHTWLLLSCILAASGSGVSAQEAPASRPEATSFLGTPLYAPALPAATREAYERRLAEARAAFDSAPTADNAIWLGRRIAYLGRYREAIAIYTDALRRYPEDARLYRHRGHRYITVRQLDSAIADLERAAELTMGQPDEVEPDGLPNERNVPTSTLQSNVWYHLGLARYLRGDFEEAADAYHRGMAVSTNPDMRVATSYWLYLTLRRLDRAVEAGRLLETITPALDVIENHDYYRLLLFYRGLVPVDSVLAAGGAERTSVAGATAAYGVGAWHWLEGNREAAERIWRSIVAAGQWPAFGHIAAEAELARLR